MRNILKQLYYLINSNDALSDFNLNFVYVFHTEYIFDEPLFKQLLDFCNNYKSITGNVVVNTIMPATNSRIKQGIIKSNIKEAEFIKRINQLKKISTIGYHGHYHINPMDHEMFEGEIHCNNFLFSEVKEQMERDLMWFDKSDIKHNGIYAPGWYFMNEPLITLLIENGFNTDYSLSYSKWFSNDWSQAFLFKNKINTGELFKIKAGNKNDSLDCVQALIGCHDTPFPQDFERNLLKIISNKNKNIYGCLSIHDDDINVKFSLKCIEYMMKKWNANFISHNSIKERFNNQDIKLFSI